MCRIIILSGLLLLCSCAKTQYIPLCPKPIEYSKQSQQQLHQELVSIPQDSQIIQYLIDYKKQREMMKVCHQEQD